MESAGHWFLGATPERLVRVADGSVDISCLAGSIGVGNSEEERLALALRLLASEKDRKEHEFVVRGAVEALQGVADSPRRAPGSPHVVAARSVQHLESTITARTSGAAGVLDLVERLHPTPAVGGYPRDPALEAISEMESIDRGWYAGPFGWSGLDGSGEFSVAIRSALIAGATASVYAGSGIVAGSVPEAEFAETELKMRPMLAALGAE
jgi:isochorismate synthase